MIYVTHDQVEAMTLADKIVVLRKGRVEQIGAPMELYENPANLFVAGFIGSPKMNFLDLEGGENLTFRFKDKSAIRLSGEDAARAAVLGLRADQMTLTEPDRGHFTGTVSVVERLGDSEFVYVATEWGQELVVRVPGGTNTPIGIETGIALSGRTHFFDSEGRSLAGIALAADRN